MKPYRVELGCHVFSAHDSLGEAIDACKQLATRGRRAYIWSMAATMIVFRNW